MSDQISPIRPHSAFTCPNCASEITQKLSMAPQGGNIVPRRRKEYSVRAFVVCLLLTPLTAFCCVPGLPKDTERSVELFWFILPMLLWPICCTILFLWLRGNKKWNREVFPALYEPWTRKWICHRCGTQFEPQTA